MNKPDGALWQIFTMDLVGTLAKRGDVMAKPFLDAGAVTVMPDGLVVYEVVGFERVMWAYLLAKVVTEDDDNNNHVM